MAVRWRRAAALAVLAVTAGAAAGPVTAQDLNPKALQSALAARPTGAQAMQLAERVRAWFGKEALARGPNAKQDARDVAWALEAPGARQPPRVVSEDGTLAIALNRLGDTDVYAAAATLPDGAAMRWSYQVDGKQVGEKRNLEAYDVHPDSREQPGVPKGTVTKQAPWKSTVFPNTERDWWVYVPAQYRPENPACVMVFQDGGAYQNYVGTVFDNLIAKGHMPVTVAVFINPGNRIPANPNGRAGSNRSFEYDTLSDQYARFLLEEILPEVEKTVKLRQDAASRAISGASSGGICAFTAAWQRPDAFSKVLSWIGSFTNIASGPTLREGGHNYPALIRKTMPRKPIRVFLQDGANDLDNAHGNWPLANQEMQKALAYAGYDHTFVYGNGFHSPAHGRAILPDSLRWLWRDYKPEP